MLELDKAIGQGIQSRIAAHVNILAGVVFGAFLADNNLAFFYGLVAENFNA